MSDIPQHIDPGVQEAWMHLNEAICSFERSTSRTYTLLLIPHNEDEEVQISSNGKDMPTDGSSTEEAFEIAIGKRQANFKKGS